MYFWPLHLHVSAWNTCFLSVVIGLWSVTNDVNLRDVEADGKALSRVAEGIDHNHQHNHQLNQSMHFYIQMVSFTGTYRCVKAYRLYTTLTIYDHWNHPQHCRIGTCCWSSTDNSGIFWFLTLKEGQIQLPFFYSCSNSKTFSIQLVFLSALLHENVYRRTQTGTLDFLGRCLGS